MGAENSMMAEENFDNGTELNRFARLEFASVILNRVRGDN